MNAFVERLLARARGNDGVRPRLPSRFERLEGREHFDRAEVLLAASDRAPEQSSVSPASPEPHATGPARANDERSEETPRSSTTARGPVRSPREAAPSAVERIAPADRLSDVKPRVEPHDRYQRSDLSSDASPPRGPSPPVLRVDTAPPTDAPPIAALRPAQVASAAVPSASGSDRPPRLSDTDGPAATPVVPRRAVERPAMRREPASEPSVFVSIGRIEVRMSSDPAAPRPSREAASAPVMSLEDYLRSRTRA